MKRSINLPLLTGALLIAFTGALAIWGPSWAPHDPLERSALLQINGEWDTPPFPPGAPGFPFGSDQGGRDIFSRVLWAVRPTMQLVMIVAVVRLFAGVGVGLVSGGGRSRIAVMLEMLTAAALAIPAILIALAVLLKLWSPVELRPRVWAFVLALALTGWAETAQVVREQTRILLDQPYIEAARALGGSRTLLFRRHILPHLMPLVWIQFTFEVGATLMLVGGLGFLGLYVGGTAPRLEGDLFTLSGYPELGEMLASTINVIVEPWGMVAAGSVVFLTVLGFNLLGQGLRLRLAHHRPRRETLFSRAGFWLEEHLTYPAGVLLRGPLWVPVRVIAALAGVGLVLWLGSQLRSRLAPEIEQIPTFVAGQIPTAFAQPFAPESTASPTESPPDTSVLWSFDPGAGTPIPPIITLDGSVYLLTHEWELFALSSEGTLLWQQKLNPAPFRGGIWNMLIPPTLVSDGLIIVGNSLVYAIDSAGEWQWEVALDAPPDPQGCCALGVPDSFYLLDREGRLYRIGVDGILEWKYLPDEPVTIESAPVIDSAGQVYFGASRSGKVYVYAVSSAGELRWRTEVPPERLSVAYVGFTDFRWLQLTSDEATVLFSGDAFDAATGEWFDFDLANTLPRLLQELNPESPIANEGFDPRLTFLRVFAGLDGRVLMLTNDLLIEWVREGSAFSPERYIQIDSFYAASGLQPPAVISDPQIIYRFVDPNANELREVADEGTIERYIGWGNLETESTGEISLVRGEYVAAVDPETGALVVCQARREQAQLACERRIPWMGVSEYLFMVEGVRSIKFIQLDLDMGRLHVFGKDNVLYVVDIEQPGE